MEPFYLCNSEIFGLSDSTAVVYNFLCRVNNVSTGKSFYKRSNIAAGCHVSESTVARALRALCTKGLLAIKSRFDEDGRQTSNNYILIDNPQLRLDSEPLPADPSKPTGDKKSEEPEQPRLFPLRLSAENSNLSPNAVKVYSYLSYRADATGRCMPSKKEIGGACSISLSTVWRAMRELISTGLIEIRRQTRLQTCGNNGTSVNMYLLKSAPDDAQAANPVENKAAADPSPAPAQPFLQRTTDDSVDSAVASRNLPFAEALFSGRKVLYEFPWYEKLPVFSRIAAHFFTHDTLPHFTGDTPRTRPKKKATFNPREKSLLSTLAKMFTKNTAKFAGMRENPAKLE